MHKGGTHTHYPVGLWLLNFDSRSPLPRSIIVVVLLQIQLIIYILKLEAWIQTF